MEARPYSDVIHLATSAIIILILKGHDVPSQKNRDIDILASLCRHMISL